MTMEIDPYNQPTVPWRTAEPPQQSSSGRPGAGSLPSAVVSVGGHPRTGLSRRQVLGATAVGLGAVAAGGFALEQWWQHGGANPFAHGPIASSTQIGHLLRRAGFGATPDDIALYSNLGFSGAVDRLLNYQQVSDDDMENRLKGLNLDLSKIQNIQQWWLLRMAWTQRPLLEKMTLFWHGVLTSSYHKAGAKKAPQYMFNQNQFLRAHAFDTFDNLLLGITGDPAMMLYLDLNASKKNAPNENYARELMELFTLGVGHYTQQDVYEGAAALTGWHIVQGQGRYVPQTHNTLTKHYLGHTGNLDYKDVIAILTNHPAAPWFICRKLFTFFAYENPSDDDVRPLVETYVKSGHNMGEVMRTLLLSPAFSSSRAYRGRVKSPVEFVVGAYKALNVQEQGLALQLPGRTLAMGQELLNPPNVAGWPGDKLSALWLNSGTWMARLNYIDSLLVGARARTTVYHGVDVQGIVNDHQIDSPERFVDYYTSFLLDGVLDKERRAQLLDYFTTPDNSKNGAHITLSNGKSYPLNRVRGTLYLILASPEYQLN